MGRGALTLAIEAEHLEMVELLVVMGVETKDALLHAIDQEFVEAVELLLEHEELLTNQITENCESKLIFKLQYLASTVSQLSPSYTERMVLLKYIKVEPDTNLKTIMLY